MTACLLLVATPAVAQQTLAPPGNSGVQQYLETVPGASGNHPVKPGGKPVLPARVRRQLQSRGSDAKNLEALVNATAPQSAQQTSKPSTSSKSAAPTAGAERGDSGVEAFRRAVTESGDAGGMGILLPIVLGASTLLLALAAVLRRRRRTG